MLNIERRAVELAQDAVNLLPPSPFVGAHDTRQARGAIACGDYSGAWLLLELESHRGALGEEVGGRGALGDALGAALCDLRYRKPATAYVRLLAAILAHESRAAHENGGEG